MKYIDVVVENNSDNTDQCYTYKIEGNVNIGDNVEVTFGRGTKLKKAYVFNVYEKLEQEIKGIKEAIIPEENLPLNEEIIATCKWMKNRYLCRYIEAVNCFLPPMGKPKRVTKNKSTDEDVETQKEEKPCFLNAEQTEAVNQITPFIHRDENKMFLLHGVTGSGKTEVYLKLVEETIQKGKTAIVMEPEIALATEIVKRFEKRFGKESIAVIHSKMTKSERYFKWKKIREGKVKIVIGARSAVFAPVENIGIIIIDEEHEATYKSDKSPKYDGIEVAMKRALHYNGVVLLGSATPSVVSYYRSLENIYQKIEMTKRYNDILLPKVKIVNMAKELRDGNTSIFSRTLMSKMKKTIEDGKQVILFLNRRGYATFVSCRDCGYALKCKDCRISKTYHKEENALVCHYCGKKEPLPKSCPECGSTNIKKFGIGTEKVQEIAKEMFPYIEIDRFDLDTIKKKGSTEKILKRFHRGKSKILIGTQLVAKGLDFQNVGLVGIISADVTLNIPDFRSSERTFQLTTQASGRAGRKGSRGEVVIQSYETDHYSIITSAENDYNAFYHQEINLRKTLYYPPFSQIIQIEIIGKEEEEVKKGADKVYRYLKKLSNYNMSRYILPPKELIRDVNKNHYRHSVLIKSPNKLKNNYLEVLSNMKKSINTDKQRGYIISVDINPY